MFCNETGFTVKLVWQGNWFGGETGLAGKLVWQGNWFLVTLAKFFCHYTYGETNYL